jgi:transcriptional regulator with XRE-family HTH domain
MSSIAATQFPRKQGKLLLAVALVPKEVGRRIARARDRKGWTQFTFAQEASISPSTVARWEAGKLPPVRELMRVADLLEVPVDELVEPPENAQELGVRLDRLEAGVAELRELLLEIVPSRRRPVRARSR